MAIKVKEGEDFSAEKIEKVIGLLDKGETKKSCCEVLGMAYNTTRLSKIISNYITKKKNDEVLRKKLRNKPLDDSDIVYMCQEYLNGEPISRISDNTYRSITIVKNVLKRYNIPLRNTSNDYFNPVLVDEDERLDYAKGDLVFSARYNSMAEIIKKVEDGVYRICVLGKRQRYAYQPSYELADLRKVQKELKINGVWETDTRQRAWQSVVDAKKKKNKDK